MSPADAAASLLDGPGQHETDTRALLVGYLDWYRDTLLRKLDGLTDEQLVSPVEGIGWSPLGLVQHLTWVERRWLRWGFRGEQVEGYLRGDEDAEWQVAAGEVTEVLDAYRAEIAATSEVVDAAALDEMSAIGGRFPDADVAPPLVRILFHLLQEYARHVGHLDIARQQLDGTVGE